MLVSPLCEREWGRTGAVLIVLYAVVVPILKLVLLAVAEVFRCSAEPKFKVALTPLVWHPPKRQKGTSIQKFKLK